MPAYKCKVCYDAGKPSNEYNSHFVRDQPGGKVVCPTILNQKCSYCKTQGHTPVHCPKLGGGKYKKKKPAVVVNTAPQPLEPKAQIKTNQQKRVEVQLKARARELCCSPPPRDDEKKIDTKCVVSLNDNFPVVSVKINRGDGGKIIRPTQVNNVGLRCWAEAAAKTTTPIVEKSAKAATEELTNTCISDIINKENKSQQIIREQLEVYKTQQQAPQGAQQQAQQAPATWSKCWLNGEQRAEEFFQKERELYMKAKAKADEAAAEAARQQEEKAHYISQPLVKSWFYEE